MNCICGHPWNDHLEEHCQNCDCKEFKLELEKWQIRQLYMIASVARGNYENARYVGEWIDNTLDGENVMKELEDM